ncbi:cytochrome oxidase complex assembly protein 1-domain-containing protein [Lasiosphaeria hispida]|uniref:Cytochrome oxidase complex assembly protein 1-domain-containing protein n=1 Tax=Lasiosphaeria hispida TaxID=260671 RepID=A0AAJ0M9N1_9PEZI|nr:cytochrome oxidase complex assembly protein 1-domain-containing protein [Lasiosphaeria hispida]
MLSRIALQRGQSALVRRLRPSAATRPTVQAPRRTLISAPKAGDGPLLERRPDRELPDINPRTHWSRTLPIFLVLVGGASIAIFNYQKLSSPVVAGTLYALRTNPRARELLGDEIYFNAQIPWIGGGMNQLHGRIDIHFKVKGTRAVGVMRFVSTRPTPRGMFETTEWSLEMEDGTKVDLLTEGGDPFKGGVLGPGLDVDDDEEERSSAAATRGYRQMPK